MDNVKIKGIIFEKGEDDYGLWEGISLSEEDENAIQQILSKYDTDGGSMGGTGKRIAEELYCYSPFNDDELFLLAQGMIALIRDVNTAAQLVPDGGANDLLREMTVKYQELNEKICKMMKE